MVSQSPLQHHPLLGEPVFSSGANGLSGGTTGKPQAASLFVSICILPFVTNIKL